MFNKTFLSTEQHRVNLKVPMRRFLTRLVAYGVGGMVLVLTQCDSDRVSPDPAAGTAANAGAANTAGTSNAGGQQAGTAGTAGFANTGRCPSKYGAAMVEVSTPNGSTYCMDSTEATRGHYAAFLKANVDGKTKPDEICPGVTDFRPRWEPMFNGEPNDPDTKKGTCYMEDYHGDNVFSPSDPDMPMTCISWCQARAYCEWAGKRLCARVGGGMILISDQGAATPEHKNAKLDEWYNACSQGGAQKYSYGDSFVAHTCSDNVDALATEPESAIDEVLGSPACTGTKAPFSTIYNLCGNVSEWVSACEKIPDGDMARVNCGIRGGSAMSSKPETEHQCSDWGLSWPSAQAEDLGFRCCAD